MVLVGEAAGLAGGVALSWLLIHVINRGSFGWTFFFQPDWPIILAALPVIAAAAVGAAPTAVRAGSKQSPAAILKEQ